MHNDKGVCLIVGAGDYIGSAIARRFGLGGYTVCMARRNGERCAEVVRQISNKGGEAFGFSMDARDEEQVVSTFAEIERDVGPLAIVIFNIGGNVNFPIRDTSERVFSKVWQMACLAGFLSGREAARYMVPRRKGSIFFTGATASLRGGIGYAAFASAKFGLRGLAQSMARELGPQNIHVAHLIIDAGVDTHWVRGRLSEQGVDPDSLPPNTLMQPESVAETYWLLHHQSNDAWSQELDLRPGIEKW